MSETESDQLLENGLDDKNELGLMEVDEVLEPESPDFKMSDRDIEDIENSLKKTLIEGYSDFRERELLNGYQSLVLMLGSNAVLNFNIDPKNPIIPFVLATAFGSAATLGWNLNSDDFGEGIFKAGDILPEAENYVDVEDLDRDYQVVETSLDQLIAESENVEVSQDGYDPEGVAEWYQDLLKDYDENEQGKDNNLQLLAFTGNEDLWEYRIELKSSGSPVESIRGLSEHHPEFYIDNSEAAEIDYEELEKAHA